MLAQPAYFGNSYRYGFQGQEADDELRGKGNSVNYKYRMHDARIGRFFAVDPLSPSYPHYTPYSFSGNKVVAFVELEGLEEYYAATGELLGSIGTSTEVRLVNANYVEQAKIDIQFVNGFEKQLDKGGEIAFSRFTNSIKKVNNLNGNSNNYLQSLFDEIKSENSHMANFVFEKLGWTSENITKQNIVWDLRNVETSISNTDGNGKVTLDMAEAFKDLKVSLVHEAANVLNLNALIGVVDNLKGGNYTDNGVTDFTQFAVDLLEVESASLVVNEIYQLESGQEITDKKAMKYWKENGSEAYYKMRLASYRQSNSSVKNNNGETAVQSYVKQYEQLVKDGIIVIAK